MCRLQVEINIVVVGENSVSADPLKHSFTLTGAPVLDSLTGSLTALLLLVVTTLCQNKWNESCFRMHTSVFIVVNVIS